MQGELIENARRIFFLADYTRDSRLNIAEVTVSRGLLLRGFMRIRHACCIPPSFRLG